MNKQSQLIAAAAITLSMAYPALAAGPTSQPADVSREMQEIRARIDQLEAADKRAEQKTHEAQQKLQDRIAADELSKGAAERDKFLTAEGFTAGYSDGRFVIQSDDGAFLLRPWAQLQFRGVAVDRYGFQGSKAHPENEVDSGFEIRQLRFGVDGNMFTPDFTYFFNWATTRTSGNATVKNSAGAAIGTVSNSLGGVPVLQQAWVKYHLPGTPFLVKVGAIKDPVFHEQIVDTRFQQGTERSLTGDVFLNGDAFTEGVTFIYDPGHDVRAEAGVDHGMRGDNTNFLSYPNNGAYNQFDYGVVGRLDYKVMGRWQDYTQMGAVGVKDQLLVFGTGADYSERGHDGQVVAVADAVYANETGLSLYGAFVDRYTTHNFGYYVQSATGATINAGDPSVVGRPTNEYAIVAEAGYIIDKHWEPFGRYEYMRLQGTPAGSRNNIQDITAGVNYYFYGHRLKLTGEIIWLPDGLPFDDTPNDILANPSGKTEFSFVTQLQLLL